MEKKEVVRRGRGRKRKGKGCKSRYRYRFRVESVRVANEKRTKSRENHPGQPTSHSAERETLMTHIRSTTRTVSAPGRSFQRNAVRPSIPSLPIRHWMSSTLGVRGNRWR